MVGFDGSLDARRALRWAAGVAEARPGTVLHLVQAVSLPPIPLHQADLSVAELLDQHEAEARQGLEAEREGLEQRGIRAEIRLRRWLPSETLLEHADRERAGLIVVGRHGTRPARLLLGSVSGEVAAAAHVPVVVLRGRERPSPPRRILLAFDGSAPARRAAESVALWAPEAEVLVLSVRPPEGSSTPGTGIDPLLEAGLDPGRIDMLEAAGDPAARLLDVAETRAVDLVAAGRRGQSSWKELLVGGVCEKLLQLAPCPVLVAH